MKPHINLAASENSVMQNDLRMPMVNELTAPAPASLLKAAELVRPHILERRTARWARRSAY
ncbi:MAG: hypothetical protein GYB49_03950 [Alphaproteobacteria bacterium]|nr:hypothetical protein [Hyphomonas sp.]MBR9806367.1 hypothetical protein [Alphaproteobacteria bacterium]|tara:strand:- start:8137 stop:8319 length:183 start_codon:yes stop_codon:yes gene_type:complete